MAVTDANTTDAARAIGSAVTIDLREYGVDVPLGTTADLCVHGDRASYVIELTRRGDTWTFEGARSAAELTAVRGSASIEDVERVPAWIIAVLETLSIDEVTLSR